ncbi:MAG: MlaE family lipid ABC transporter permease subunit [Chthoniobacterales bacterium]
MSSTAGILKLEKNGGTTRIVLSGRVDAISVAKIWQKTLDAVSKDTFVEASGIAYCDGAGSALLCELKRRGARIDGLQPEIARIVALFEGEGREESKAVSKDSQVVALGKFTAAFLQDLREQVEFLGRMLIVFLSFRKKEFRLRWNDVWFIFERAGVQALLVVGLVSFLTGLIIAFQAAPPLQRYGADIFVVNLVGLAMVRELGPIMTAIVLAGRSGSAFAAEIGTMKVNEEIDALNTMGLDPVRFLVAPRVLAGILVTPILIIYSDLMGVAGGFFVMLARGFPTAVLWSQLTSSIDVNDILAGVIKGFFLGALVAGIGCLRGLQTREGASSVGISTTSSVVTSIFLIVVIDALFAVVYFMIKF